MADSKHGTLRGKRSALVTGSTSGIGLGVARALAQHGYNVTLNGFGNATEIAELTRVLSQEFSVQVRYSAADLMKPHAARDMIHEHIAAFGAIDVLVNNAGIQHVSAVEVFPEEKWDAIMALNLSAVFHATKAAIPSMKARGWGRIVQIASVHGLVASPYKSAYVAAKHGVIGFTKSLALELAESEITCNAICPGYVKTPLVENQIADQATAHHMPREQVIRDVILASQPNKKFIEVDAVASMVAFLCQPEANGITGSSFTLDGGWTAR